MTAEIFHPADPETWRSRGRSPEHATLIADAWRRYPDLPSSTPLADRMARTRQRVEAMRPVFQEIAVASRRAQHKHNFAFTAAQLERGGGSDREVAILRGRDTFDLGWDEAVAFANGWIACHLGWTFSPPRTGYKPEQSAAYKLGFADAGGDVDDLFDTARRQYRVAERMGNQPPVIAPSLAPRPLPSSWGKPTDGPKPARWDRRLIIMSHADAFADCLIDVIATHPGSDEATIIILSPDLGYIDIRHPLASRSRPLSQEAIDRLSASAADLEQLRCLIGDREYEDVLVVAGGGYLQVLDAHASALPLCHTMERAQNSLLQRRAHIRTWLERGFASGETPAAGHIRWSKMSAGLEARLGEFSARYEGSAGRGLHVVILRDAEGRVADGYVTPHGRGLDPRITLTSKAAMKKEMTRILRTFAAATRLLRYQ